jgi:hypothetical protein
MKDGLPVTRSHEAFEEINATVTYSTTCLRAAGTSSLSASSPRKGTAMGSVINLHGDIGPWAPYERTVLAAIQQEFSAQGIETDCEHGRAEDGTPWTAFYAHSSGHFVAHVARHKRNYILMWPDHTSVQTRDMEQLVSVVRRAAYYHAQERGT